LLHLWFVIVNPTMACPDTCPHDYDTHRTCQDLEHSMTVMMTTFNDCQLFS